MKNFKMRKIFLCHLFLWVSAQGSVVIEDFFSFGPENGDSSIPPNDDGSVNVTLAFGSEFRFFNSSYSNIFINNNGGLSFRQGVSTFTPECGPLNVPMIVPFWADIDTRQNGGFVYYRQTMDRTLLEKATRDIRLAFPSLRLNDLDWSFVVTWHEVAFFGAANPTQSCEGRNKRNTFQLVITTDGFHSFALIYYNKVSWTTGEASGGNSCTGLGGTAAKAGFDYGDRLTFETIPGSCTPEILNVSQTTNVNQPGKWVFRVDDQLVSGGCDDVESSSARLSPSFVPSMGHVPLLATVACLEDSVAASCIFHDKEMIRVEGTIDLEGHSVICQVPYLYSQGRMMVDVAVEFLDSETKVYSGYIYSIPEPHDEILFNITDISQGRIQMSWNPDYFGTTTTSLKLALVKLGDADKFEEVGILIDIISNSGAFSGTCNPGVLQSLNSTYSVYLAPNSVPQSKAVPILARFLFSRLLYASAKLAAIGFDALCNDWHSKDRGSPNDLLPCPPTLALAREDSNFEADKASIFLWLFHPGAEQSFRQRVPSPSGGGQQCTYKNGQLYARPPGGGTADVVSPNKDSWGHFKEDVLPWMYCCLLGVPDNRESQCQCRKYFDKRPSDQGTEYVPPRPGGGNGDPHITTFDLLTYTFNGVGEFWMIQHPQLKMQGRMEQIAQPAPIPASIFTAFAMEENRVGGEGVRVVVELSRNNGGLLIFLDDIEITMEEGESPELHTFTHQGVSISIDWPQNQITLAFSSGFTFQITATDNLLLNILASANPSLKGTTKGLLGIFDGVKENDLTDPSGAVLPIDGSSLQSIHSDFGVKWRITEEESLFTYPPGKSYGDYQDLDFTPNFESPDLSQIPEEVLQLCGGTIECLYDFANTGSLALANGTKEESRKLEEIVELVEEEVKMCPLPQIPVNGYFAADNFLLGSIVTFYCDNSGEEQYDLVGSDRSECVGTGAGSQPNWKDPAPLCRLKVTDVHDGAALLTFNFNLVYILLPSFVIVFFNA